MTQYNLALAKMAGVAERLKSQVNGKAIRAQELERRILANHRAGNMELAGTLARELQELKADLTVDSQRAEGDRGGLPGQPAPGEARAARVRGQGPPPREAALAGQDQGSAGRGGHGAVERRVQGRRSRRHDEDGRRDAAEALRGLGRQGARRQGHGRHRSRRRRRRTSARRSSRSRSPSSSPARASRRRRRPNAAAGGDQGDRTRAMNGQPRFTMLGKLDLDRAGRWA